MSVSSEITRIQNGVSDQTTLITDIKSELADKGSPVLVNLYNESTRVEGHYIAANGVSYEDSASSHSARIPCQANTTYTFSGTTASLSEGNKRFHVYDANGTWISQLVTWLIPHSTYDWAIQGTTPDNGAYLAISMYTADTNIMVFEGNSAPNAYYPYHDPNKTQLAKNTDALDDISTAVEAIEPTLQSKTVTPSTSQQQVTADSDYDGLDTVTVNAIQTETKNMTLGSAAPSAVTPTSGKFLTSVVPSIDTSVINAENIAEGATILGISGTHSGGGGIEEISTDAGMTAVLIAANVGKIYKFTGTTGTYKNGDLYIVAEIGSTGVYAFRHYSDRTPPTLSYLCFTAEQANSTVAMSVSGTPTQGQAFEYSTNGGRTWSAFVPRTTTITLDEIGDSAYFRGNNTTVSESESIYYRFQMTGRIAASGSVMSLVDITSVTIRKSYCFYSLFYNCTSLTTAPELPATGLSLYCYQSMFYNCTSLTTAPALPATGLTSYCYQDMFYGCTSLTTAPTLPAIILANYCYHQMFRNCTSLTTAPALPAISLTDSCYADMFRGCTSLTIAPELPATTLKIYCYANMFAGCTSLITAPELPATNLDRFCYINMFGFCTNLTTVPALPATTLADYCYELMFYSCKSLKVSESRTGTYQYAWRIPTNGTGTTASYWNTDMLTNTGGTFKSNPTINTTYYVENKPVPMAMPTKGQLITMTLGNATPAAGTQDTYRVLSVEGNIAFVVAMFDQSTSVYFNESGDNAYAGSDLDTYLNTTWYNSLNSTAKSAIVATNITQYQYANNSSAYNDTTHASYADYSTKASKAVVGNRYVYAPDVEDIETYFNSTFSTADIWTLFWNKSTQPSNYTVPWLRSVCTSSSIHVFDVYGYFGCVSSGGVNNYGAARPAFKIDLSKISWT